MNSPHRLLLDMSSVMWKCLLAGKDKENGHAVPNPDPDKADVWVNSAEYGFENFVNSIVSLLKRFDAAPRDIVMVFDGENSKAFRRAMFPAYKEGREHHPDSYTEFDKLREKAEDTLLGLGALSARQSGYEADDVLAYLAQRLQGRKTVITNDGDLLVLHNESTDVFRDSDLNVNKYGPFPFRHITLYKALVGDSSDNIKGAKGFGPKSFIELFCAFDDEGLDVMIDLIKNKHLDRLSEDVPTLKCLQRIIDSAESVYTSWDLAQLYPGRINSGRKALQVTAGMCRQWNSEAHDERLKSWYGASRIISQSNYASAKGWALQHLLESDHIGYDIETSVPDESDEWLEAKKRSAGGEEGGRTGVDVFGSKLTGNGVTFGKNQQYSLYFTVGHIETDGHKNLTEQQVREFVELIPKSKRIVVQNASFELTVLHQIWGEAWKDNGYEGFLPNIDDTKLMKSYVDENTSTGLKPMSASILGYDQATYEEVTQGRKMDQLTAREVVAYGLDDPICTSALYTYLKFTMELEGTWDVYRAVEIGAAYLNAQRFLSGTHISIEKMNELSALDDKDHAEAWALLRDYLIARGWEGTVPPTYGGELAPAQIKEAFLLVSGRELKTLVRTPEKLVKLIEAEDEELLASLVSSHLKAAGAVAAAEGEVTELAAKAAQDAREALEKYVRVFFKGEPALNFDSTTQMRKLLYETLGLEVRLRNKPTETMRKEGITEGGERTDSLTLEFALTYDTDKGPEIMAILKAIQTIKSVETRRKLYYKPYANVKHWKDNLVHPQINQCQARTRRASSSEPNLQQLPKHPKQGKPARFREIFVPHKKNAVIVSLDFSQQELRSIAEQSRDENMLACFIGDHKKDMHTLTGAGILAKKSPTSLWRLLGREIDAGPEFVECAQRWSQYTYATFEAVLNDPSHPDFDLCRKIRQIGKTVNFSAEFGAQAPKIAEVLITERAEAQQYLDAKLEAFPGAERWKQAVMAQSRLDGYTTTMLGARRHLAEGLFSGNKFDIGSAERQGVNFKVQGSCAEQTKLAEGRLWKSRIFSRYDAKYIAPVHDEILASVVADQAVDFIREMHAAMTAGYAGMTVPVVSSVSLGRNLGEQIECGDCFNEEKINEALQSLGFAVNMTHA